MVLKIPKKGLHAEGTGKFIVLVTGKSETPHFFKNTRKMPIGYVTS
jgi:hypothetical protein